MANMTANPAKPKNRWAVIVGTQWDFVEPMGNAYVVGAERLVDPITDFVRRLDARVYAGILMVGARAGTPRRITIKTGHIYSQVWGRDSVDAPSKSVSYVEEIPCAFGTPGFRQSIPHAIVPRDIQTFQTFVPDARLVGLYGPRQMETSEGSSTEEMEVDYWTGQNDIGTTAARHKLEKFTANTLHGCTMDIMGVDVGAGCNNRGAIDEVVLFFVARKIASVLHSRLIVTLNDFDGETPVDYWQSKLIRHPLISAV